MHKFLVLALCPLLAAGCVAPSATLQTADTALITGAPDKSNAAFLVDAARMTLKQGRQDFEIIQNGRLVKQAVDIEVGKPAEVKMYYTWQTARKPERIWDSYSILSALADNG